MNVLWKRFFYPWSSLLVFILSLLLVLIQNIPGAIFAAKWPILRGLNSSYNDYHMDIRILFHDMDVIFLRIGIALERRSSLGGNQVIFLGIKRRDILAQVTPGFNFVKSFSTRLAEATDTVYNERGPYTFESLKGGVHLLFSRDDQAYFLFMAKAFQIRNTM